MLDKSDIVGFMKQELINDAEMLHRIEAFLTSNRIGASSFGRSAIGDPRLIGDMRKGKRSITLRTANRIAAFMETYAPTEHAS
jgi:hypothetical protein